ncbi:MAG: hypothetical protein ACKO72_03530 [Actinomycetes bacterium]
MTGRVATAVWRLDPGLVLALEEHLGVPVDSYLNGSQVWLVDCGPGGETLEFRLHPVAGYRPPEGVSHYDLWEEVAGALSRGVDPAAMTLGDTTRALEALWDGLEVFEAYGDSLEPAQIANAAGAAISRDADRCGLVDHDRAGGEWERRGRAVSLFGLIEEQLAGS